MLSSSCARPSTARPGACRYADRAKNIVNNVFVNEDATAAIISALRGDIEKLRKLQDEEDAAELHAEMEEIKRLLREANLTWEEKLQATERALIARAEAAEADIARRAKENASLAEENAKMKQQLELERQARQAAEQAAELERSERERERKRKQAEEREKRWGFIDSTHFPHNDAPHNTCAH
jgi:colicin import membrane protein